MKTLISFLSAAILLTAGTSSAEASIYSEVVAPILDARCVQCHGEEKEKGKLRLDSFEGIIKGGSEAEDGNIVAGDPEKSHMMERVHYPLDDDEHMPPEDEITLLEWWIRLGAKGKMTIAEAMPSKPLMAIITEFKKNVPKAEAVAKAKVPTPAEKKAMDAAAQKAAAAMAKINATGASLMPISAASDTELRFTALNAAKEFGDSELALLKPVASQIL